MCSMYLHSRLRQTCLRRQALPGADTWVVALLELLLKLLQLVRTESRPVPSKLGLIRAIQTPCLVLTVDICNRESVIRHNVLTCARLSVRQKGKANVTTAFVREHRVISDIKSCKS
jgi:hypothetical protein